MSKIYSYVLRYDDGAAPNPFWDVCTLAICKPAIRRTAEVGDWVIGTGSKHAKCNDGKIHDLSQHLVYAMKVTDKMTLKQYNEHCLVHLPDKIPKSGSRDWRRKMGDCIYFDSGEDLLSIRPGSVHQIMHRDRDMGGISVLLSEHFYYFGERTVPIPPHLTRLIKRNQGHLKIMNPILIEQFEEWISGYNLNKLTGEPQLKHAFDKANCSMESYCVSNYIKEDEEIEESTLC